MSHINFEEVSALAESHRENLMQQAEQWRLAKRSKLTNRPARPVYAPALARTGSLLIRVGNRLQARYTQPSDGDSLDQYATGTFPIS